MDLTSLISGAYACFGEHRVQLESQDAQTLLWVRQHLGGFLCCDGHFKAAWYLFLIQVGISNHSALSSSQGTFGLNKGCCSWYLHGMWSVHLHWKVRDFSFLWMKGGRHCWQLYLSTGNWYELKTNLNLFSLFCAKVQVACSLEL